MWRLCLVALLAACGSGGGATVGKPCGGPDDCETRSTAACILRWPEGYCTEVDCAPGSCPSGSQCVRGIEFANVPLDAFCLLTCEDPGDCRSGYSCTAVAGVEKVCVPTNP